jgi:hypothetical protein
MAIRNEPAEMSPSSAPPARPAVVFGLGTALLVANGVFITYTYLVVQALGWTQTALLRPPVVALFLLAAINALLLRPLARRFALTSAELVILYSMLCVATCAAGQSFVQMLVNQLAAPYYHASGTNGWRERLWPYLPAWLSPPNDPAVLNGFFRGNVSLYAPAVLRGWAVPTLAWSSFIFALFWVLLCLTSLVRRRWADEERLTFPLVVLPLEMARSGENNGVGGTGPFWRSRGMWIGFTLAVLLESLNYLNFLYPNVPGIPLKPVGPNQLDTLFTERPWNQIGTFRLAFYPFAIGIGYLLSLEVSFSCWSLYLLSKAVTVLCVAFGWTDGAASGAAAMSGANRAPFLREQGVGAFLGIAVFSLWAMRAALAAAWREAVRPTGADADELMSHRLALLGGGFGLLFLLGFLVVAGLPPLVALVFLFVYLCIALTLARIISEAGAGWAYGPSWTPVAFTTDLFGASHLSPQALVPLQVSLAWTGDMRDVPLAQQMHGARLGQEIGLPTRALLKPLVWAALVGILCAFWAHLDAYYTNGHATAKVRVALSNLATNPARAATSLLLSPTPADWPGLAAAVGGGLFALSLSVLRQRLTGWPLHPLGYALATTQSLDYMWFPFFLAWGAKFVTLRYGGIRAYRSALPFFLGLILGDYVAPVAWSVIGMMTGSQMYMAFPH